MGEFGDADDWWPARSSDDPSARRVRRVAVVVSALAIIAAVVPLPSPEGGSCGSLVRPYSQNYLECAGRLRALRPFVALAFGFGLALLTNGVQLWLDPGDSRRRRTTNSVLVGVAAAAGFFWYAAHRLDVAWRGYM